MTYTYNENKTIRTAYTVEVIYWSHRGFIGRLPEVEYEVGGSWIKQGSRWLINEDDAVMIMNTGYKSADL